MKSTVAIDHGLPTDIDKESADHLRKIIAGTMTEDGAEATFRIASEDGQIAPVVLTPNIARTFLDVLRLISSGRGFQIIPYKAELTTQQAADFLNMSRPFLIKLLERGEIDFTTVGRHRRVRAEDLFAYQKRRDEERAAALQEMIQADEAEGLL